MAVGQHGGRRPEKDRGASAPSLAPSKPDKLLLTSRRSGPGPGGLHSLPEVTQGCLASQPPCPPCISWAGGSPRWLLPALPAKKPALMQGSAWPWDPQAAAAFPGPGVCEVVGMAWHAGLLTLPGSWTCDSSRAPSLSRMVQVIVDVPQGRSQDAPVPSRAGLSDSVRGVRLHAGMGPSPAGEVDRDLAGTTKDRSGQGPPQWGVRGLSSQGPRGGRRPDGWGRGVWSSTSGKPREEWGWQAPGVQQQVLVGVDLPLGLHRGLAEAEMLSGTCVGSLTQLWPLPSGLLGASAPGHPAEPAQRPALLAGMSVLGGRRHTVQVWLTGGQQRPWPLGASVGPLVWSCVLKPRG